MMMRQRGEMADNGSDGGTNRATNSLGSVSNFMGVSVTEVMSASFGPKMYNCAKVVPVTARCNC
jgi:hypothetical protein